MSSLSQILHQVACFSLRRSRSKEVEARGETSFLDQYPQCIGDACKELSSVGLLLPAFVCPVRFVFCKQFLFLKQAFLAYGIPQNNGKRILLLLKVPHLVFRLCLHVIKDRKIHDAEFTKACPNAGSLQCWRAHHQRWHNTELDPQMPVVSTWTGKSKTPHLF